MRRMPRSHLFLPPSLQWNLLRGLFWLLATFAVLPLDAAAEGHVPGTGIRLYGGDDVGPKPSWQAGVSTFFATGDYGTAVRTDVLYTPVSLRRLFDNGDLTLVLPYVTVTSDCGVTVVSGQPLRTGGLCRPTPSGTLPGRVTTSGIGDVLLIGRYYLVDEHGLLPSIMVSGRVKAPTADRDRGLGTGEWDEGGGLGLTKLITDKLVSFADAGYTFIGDPQGVNLRNQWSYDVGLGYYFLPTVLVSLYYEEARAIVPAFENPRDVFLAGSWKVTEDFRLTAGFEKGLSTGAPDYGANLGASMRF